MIQKVANILTKKERILAIWTFAHTCVAALLEVMSVASLAPFLLVISDSDSIHSSKILNEIFLRGSFKSVTTFIAFIGAVTLAFIALSAIGRSISYYWQVNFVQGCRHTISARLLKKYVSQNYDFFAQANSSDLSKNVLSEVDYFVDRVMLPLSSLVTSSITLFFMSIFLLIVNPLVACVIAIVVIAAYGMAYAIVKKVSSSIAIDRVSSNKIRFRAVADALGGIKTVKATGREDEFLTRYNNASSIFSKTLAVGSAIGLIPKYVIEAIAFSGLILIAIVFALNAEAGDGAIQSEIFPLLGMYAFAGYRMLPAAQGIYQSITTMKVTESVVDLLNKEMKLPSISASFEEDTSNSNKPFESLKISDLTYFHPGAAKPALNSVTFSVNRGERIGIIGPTGSGKTTLIDVLVGLKVPHSGELQINNKHTPLNELGRIRRQIGYVPQFIYLCDGSVAENVAFGRPQSEIDFERVENCLEQARLMDFIRSQPCGLQAMVGDRGVRLSGGQIQRIGIARALYNQPTLIIFDEGTSALDYKTEAEVIETLLSLDNGPAVVMVAHRTDTVKACDRLYLLDEGRVVAEGTFESFKDQNFIRVGS